MNKFQAMARIMMLINDEYPLKPGSREYKLVRKMISYKIDRLGPEGAIAQIKDTKSHLLAQLDHFSDAFDTKPTARLDLFP
jgi:hypothetical protein